MMRQVAHLATRSRYYSCTLRARSDIARAVRLTSPASRGLIGEEATDL